ncbi:MAG TPA: hypothetical protein VLE74_01880 [Candidatus Saccharimonadales bacterium]|nr:hypothetical protein [Candidatus Saccharimonadales bacterium]
MTKNMTGVFGTMMLLLTYYVAQTHSTFWAFILAENRKASLLRASLLFMTILYCYWGAVRNSYTRHLLLLVGAALIYLSIAALCTSQLADAFNYYALPIDVFFGFEWGIITLLVAIEQPLSEQKLSSTIAPRKLLPKPAAHKALPARTKTA